jgi:hypothetical protein
MTTTTQDNRSHIKEHPPIVSAPEQNGELHGFTLWENLPREGQELSPKAPHMVGDLHLEGGETIGVVVWVTPPTVVPGKKGKPNQQKSAYCSVARTGKDPKTGDFYKGYIGFLRPVNTKAKAEDGSINVPYLTGKMTINGDEKEFKGFMTGAGINFMEHLGFTLEVIEYAETLFQQP